MPGRLPRARIYTNKKREAGLKQAFAMLLLIVLVGACTGIDQSAPNQVQAEVSGEKINLVLPDAYCFDERSSDRNSKGAFFLAVTCDPAQRSGNAAITIFVSNEALVGNLRELEDFLRNDGVVLLGKSIEPEKISVVETQIRNDVLYIKVRDTGAQPVPDAPETFWRSFFVAGNRMVGLTVAGIAGTRLTDGESVAILKQVVEETRASNTGND